MDRREFIAAVFGTALGLKHLLKGRGRRPAAPPNIIVILADDLGYADVGCYSGGRVPTPGIDRLAAEGVVMTDGYVSSAVCSPSRAGLMTGRYQQRFGYYTNRSREPGLPMDELTLTDLLKQAGYATGMVGKWDLGLRECYRPLYRGFDEFYGFLLGSPDYFDVREDSKPPVFRGTKRVNETGYLTQILTREAVSFVERHRDRPFFLYLAHHAVHAPKQAPLEYLLRFGADTPAFRERDGDLELVVRFREGDPVRNTYLAMLACMDDGIAEVLNALDAAGVSENTLVFFLSDNGGASGHRWAVADNGPLRGGKGHLWEGGIRVPFIVRWPAGLPAGKRCSIPCLSLDILPTALSAAGIDLPDDRPIDGTDMGPVLRGQSTGPLRRELFWAESKDTWAVRRGRWKLVYAEGRPMLSDLKSDIGEERNLAAERPGVVRRLRAQCEEWLAQMPDPSGAELAPGKPMGHTTAPSA